MDHATEALLRLLRFDSGFLDAYSPAQKYSEQSAYKRKQAFAQIKQFFVLRKEKLFWIAGMYLVMFLVFSIFNIFLNGDKSFNNRNLHWIVYGTEILILVLIACIYAIKEITALHPIEVRHAWVNFSFDELDLEKCNARIILNDSRPIFHVVISWWLSSGKISQDTQELGNLKGNSSMNFRALKVFNQKTILQLGYELANGDHYVHLISRKREDDLLREENKTIVYCERIFRIDGQKDNFVGLQNAVIKHVLPRKSNQ